MNSHNGLRHFIIFSFLCVLVAWSARAQFANFVTRAGDKLLDGDRQLRFISFNIPNLHYIEDYLPFQGTNPWRLPDEFEIRDALRSVRQCGGKVARIYTLSVRREDDTPDIIRHVEGPGQFNEEAFKALDKVLQVANEEGVRLMIPFVDNWHWWGGPKEYSGFRGKPPEAFWTDPEVIGDLKTTIAFLINRRNTYTGQLYRDDKAILAWETGNELRAPFSWTSEIAAYIKSLDSNHLLAEGTIIPDLSQEAVDDPHIDILTTHHYRNPQASIEYILQNQAMARGKKPYVVGEYGIVPLQDIQAITDTVIHQGLAGAMIWSLRFRNRDGGFYHHYEYNRFESYRWPGFTSGDFYDERLLLSILRDKAYEIDGELPPRLPAPPTPLMLESADPARLSWQGSAGAQWYMVARQEAGMDTWDTVASRVDDSRLQYRPLFNDESAVPGRQYSYRVRAHNESGSSAWSNTVGPIAAVERVLVDELENFERIFQKEGALRLLTYQDLRRAKEDRSRLAGVDGSYIMYKLPEVLAALRVEWLKTESGAHVLVQTSRDGEEFTDLPFQEQAFAFGKNDYGFYDAVATTADPVPPGVQFVKLSLLGGVQIGTVELRYGRLAP